MASSNQEIQEELSFRHIPDFAQYILAHHMEVYVKIQIRLSRELDLPILKYFSHMSEAELETYSIQTSTEFLTYLAENKATEQLQLALDDWKKNQLKFVSQDQIALDDIFLITRMRKKTFLELLRSYTSDIDTIYKLVEEFDRFFLAYDRETTNTYIELLQNRLQENIYFKEKLSETSPGFYYIYDIKNDRQIQKTEKLFNYLGYSENDYKDDDRFFRSLIHPAELADADSYVGRMKDAGSEELHFFEYRLKEKNGSDKWMRNYESIYKKDENGKASQILGVAFDISKERFITDELVKREAELLEAQELANMGSYMWDINGNEGYRTPQTEKILGLKKEDRFDEFMEKIHPSDKKAVQEAVQQALHGTGGFDCEYRITVNGKEKIIWGRGKVTFKDGEPVNMKGTIMDVTNKHYMVRKLKRSEELYKQAQALNKLGNWTWEIKTDSLHWSDELYRIYGMEPQAEAVNFEKFISFIHPDDRETRLKQLEEQFATRALKEYYFKIIAADGAKKILYGQSQVLADEHNVPYKIIGTCQDVTKQKELEHSLYKKTVQLERSNASLEEFAYISSHDLKEPLRKIAVFADKLKTTNEAQLDASGKDTINKIVQATGRMQRMIDEILSLAQITSEHSFKEYNLTHLLDEVTASLETEIAEHKASIRYKDLPAAYINETQFRQLFLNLLSNSFKFRRPGISPVIEISHCLLPKAEVSLLNLDQGKKYLQISYTDNGIGFGAESANKIFTIFHRLHTRDQYEGTGIGLAICKKIVEHHHGSIQASGEPGKGAAFKIAIPA
jgi:PAS domain S-box-containing protein